MTYQTIQKFEKRRKYIADVLLNAVLLGCIFLALTGCTGTKPTKPEILFALAAGDTAANSNIVLIDSNDFSVLPQSRLPLPAPPIDIDVVDRRNLRTELVVLTRLLEPTNPLATIIFLNTEAISQGNPSAFAESRTRLDVNLESLRIDKDVSPAPISFCPTKLEVDTSGRYIALMNDQSECDRSDVDAIDIIDLEDVNGPTVIVHIETPILTEALFIAQRAGLQDVLYFFQEEAGNPELYIMPIPEDKANPTIAKPESLDIKISSNVGDSIVDFAPYNDNYLVLREKSFVVIPNSGGRLEKPSANGSVTTSNDVLRIVPNDFRDTSIAMFLSSDKLTVHKTAIDQDEQITRIRDAIGIIEPLNEFAYFFRGTTISRFDLLAYQDEINSSNFVNSTISGIEQEELISEEDVYNPRAVAWIQARLDISTSIP